MTEMFDEKRRAAGWFRALRDEIVAAFEALEDAQRGPAATLPAGPVRGARDPARPRTAAMRAAG